MNAQSHDSKGLARTAELTAMNPRSPRKFSFILTVLALLLSIGVAAGIISRSRQKAALAIETREFAVSTVTVASPKPGASTAGMPLPAEIKPWMETPISARANGYLKNRYVDIGTHVEAGQLLAEIDTPELHQEFARAQGQLVQAETAFEASRRYSARWAQLVESGSVSVQENADKQSDFKLKAAAVDSARAEVRRLEQLLSFNRLTAPFAGSITARTIDSGDLIVAAGGKELFHLAQTQKLRVFVQAPQGLAHAIRPGQTAEVTLQELPGRVFHATVVRTAGVMAADSRTLLVELEVGNPKEEILAGSYAQVRFTEAKMEAVLTLPVNTVLFRPEGPRICVVQEDGTVEIRPVKLGRDFGQMIEVLVGVEAKERVIVNPSESLENGSVVAISETTPTGKGP